MAARASGLAEAAPAEGGVDLRRLKMADVARLAGVSTATVSRALTRPDRVSAETRAMVLDAVAQTGFRLNGLARALRTRNNRTLMLALGPRASLAEPVVAGMAAAAAAHGYALVAAVGTLPGAEPVALPFEGRVDGLLVLGGPVPPGLADPRLPALCLDEAEPGAALPVLRADDAQAARETARHLLALGHRRILHLGLPGPAGARRRAGFASALEEAGLPEEACHALTLPADAAGQLQMLYRVLDEAGAFTAFHCAEDGLALALLRLARRRGLCAPAAFSITGLGDGPGAAAADPPLTTARAPREALGRRAAELLIGWIERAAAPAPQTLLPAALVVRGSTARPRVRGARAG